MLNFELLRAFVAVAECVGFHRAVEQLNLTQLTVRPEIAANTICRCWLESALLLAQEVKLLSCFSQLVAELGMGELDQFERGRSRTDP